MEGNWGLMFMAIPFGVCQLVFSIIWVHDMNQKRHWIKWCDKQQNPNEVDSK